MNVITTRAKLDSFLNDPELTLLLLFVDSPTQRALATAAGAISAAMPWRQAVVVADLGLLTSNDITSMAAAADRYAVLGTDVSLARVLADSGPSPDLLLPDGSPSVMRLRKAFAKGDQA